MKECESCGAMFESHEEFDRCTDCEENEPVPLTKSILEFWKKRTDWVSGEDEV
jgi:hypothetical protein